MNREKAIKELIQQVSEEFNGILRANIYEIGLDENELTRLKIRKRELRTSLKNCGIGDDNAKRYIKSAIKNVLTDKLVFKEEDISNYISFDNSRELSIRDMFDISLYIYKREYQSRGFERMIEQNGFSIPKINEEGGFVYKITKEEIRDVFDELDFRMEFIDKLEILTQRIYADYRGLGVIDEIRDMNIDGVSGGVSGDEEEFNSVWVFYKGVSMHLEFLDFGSEEELERICMNIYRYGSPGQLSMAKGYIVNEMKDHSRVVVVRPPFSESFAFFVRKFDTIENKRLEELITDSGKEKVISVLKWIVKGCQITAITGTQGSGKTTLLMALIGYIHPAYTLRIQEVAFELHLRSVYKDRNILTFRETDFISGQEGLDIQKKTDGVVNILGEVATAAVSAWLIQMSMVASLFTLFTHHAKTTDGLIKYIRNSLLSNSDFHNDRIAEEQVVDAIRFDVHMDKDIYGHRYIERITEIIPLEDSKRLYKLNEIIRFEDGRYIFKNRFSNYSENDIIKHISKEERKKFYEDFAV